ELEDRPRIGDEPLARGHALRLARVIDVAGAAAEDAVVGAIVVEGHAGGRAPGSSHRRACTGELPAGRRTLVFAPAGGPWRAANPPGPRGGISYVEWSRVEWSRVDRADRPSGQALAATCPARQSAVHARTT